MKNIIATLVAVIAAVPAVAVPDVVTYAARVENGAGPFDGTVSAVFQLFDAPTGGTELWSETATSIVVVDGDLVHDLGSTEPLDDSVLARNDVFLAVTFNGDTLSPRAAIRAVPFALKARDAETLGGLSSDDVATDVEVDAAVASVTFADLLGVPAGFADSVDNDTLFTAGAGLKLTGTAFSIADNGVTLQTMADGSVASAEIVDNSVAGVDILNDTLTSADLGPSSVGASELAINSVGESNLLSNSVTSAKILTGAVGGSEVLDGSIRQVDIARLALVQSPLDCGTNLVIDDNEDGTATCRSLMCGVSAGVPRFFDCSGNCDESAARTCSFNRNIAGYIVQP